MTAGWIDKVQPPAKRAPAKAPAKKAAAKSKTSVAPVEPETITLRQSVEGAVASMTWLKPSDQAVVDIALVYADRIDGALAKESGPNVTKALYLGPHLLNAIRALGGAPAERKALGAEEPVNGKLAQLRAVAGGKSS